MRLKRISLLIFVCLFSPALANEPGQAALDFLGKVKAGKVDLKPGGDTALKSHTADGKRKVIKTFLQNLSSQISDGKLELGEIREDGSFAAVMVRQQGGLDCRQLQVFPVALVKGDEGWRAAPILASFENAVAGYTVPLKKRLSTLEQWMAKQRVLDLQNLIKLSADRTREMIQASIAVKDLQGNDLPEILERFRIACAAGNQAEVLAYLGGAAKRWPEDWELRMSASLTAISKTAKASFPWRLFVSPEVLRIAVLEKVTEDSGMVSLACLDPALAADEEESEKVHIIHFSFTKNSEGSWQIDLPESLLKNDSDMFFESQGMDGDLLNEFSKRIKSSYPVSTFKSLEEAEKILISGLQAGDFRGLLRQIDLSGKSKAVRLACGNAAADWWSLNSSGVFQSPVRLGIHEQGNLAVVAYQWFSGIQPDSFELRSLYFRKIQQGWIWEPGSASGVKQKEREIFSDWLREQQPQWRENWRDSLLELSLKLNKIPSDQLPGDAEVRVLIDAWITALKANKLHEALSMSVWLGNGQKGKSSVLRNLSYEFESASRNEIKLSDIYRSEFWVAAAISYREGNKVTHSFVPIISTDKGLKVIPQINLIAGNNRTRDFLNKATFDWIDPYTDKAAGKDLSELFTEFEKKSIQTQR